MTMMIVMQQSNGGIQARRTKKVDYRQDMCRGSAGGEMRTILGVFDVDVNK
jgi:hypothetical protein